MIPKKEDKTNERLAGAVFKKMMSYIIGIIGAPTFITIILCGLVMFCLPSLIWGVLFGTDSKYNGDNLSYSVGSSWEDDAEAAINEKYAELKEAAFWSDLDTFFSTGTWGKEKKLFKTRFANAKDKDESYDDYFSSSNRLIAITNEAYRLSRERGPMDTALAKANDTAFKEEVKNFGNSLKPASVTDPDKFTVFVLDPEIDPDYDEDLNFIYESCYAVAASSNRSMEDDEFEHGVRNMLDTVFDFTSLSNTDNSELLWDTYVTYVADEVHTWEVEVPEYEPIDPADPMSPLIETGSHIDRYASVTMHIYYGVIMKSNYKDIINEAFSVETELPDDANEWAVPNVEVVETSALELYKFYSDDWIDSSDWRLPIEEYKYTISSTYGLRMLEGKLVMHYGVDLATNHVIGIPVYAVTDGVVEVARDDGAVDFGVHVRIRHDDDDILTIYGHMDSFVVKAGDHVTKGQLIGYSGNTGHSTGPHLHFEIRKGGISQKDRIDPSLSEIWFELELKQM